MQYMLTTIDNPYNPFIDFDSWWAWDRASGYFTCELLGRIVASSSELSDADQDLAIELAIDEIVTENVLGVYRKIGEHEQLRDVAHAEQ